MRDPAGRPVGGATVRVLLSYAADDHQCRPIAEDTVAVITRGDGGFSGKFWSGPANHTACVHVAVTPPPGSGLNSAEVEAPGVQFQSVEQRPPESRVDVVLTRR